MRAALVTLLLVASAVAVLPNAESASPPAKCSVANIGNWWAYQQIDAAHRLWDQYSSQSEGVCVMEPPNRAPGSCTFAVQSPQWTAGGLASGDLCWYGTRATPTLTFTAPAGCTATALSGRAAYSDATVRATWDAWSAETLGVCESTTSNPTDCKYKVQEAATKWLCWWPAKSGKGLKKVLDRSAYETVARAALEVPEVCDFVGSGRTVIEIRAGNDKVQVLLENCRVTDVQWLSPPNGCADVDPARYAALVGQAAIDSGLAGARGVCLLYRAPQKGECTSVLPLTGSSSLCFWGKPSRGGAAAAASILDGLALEASFSGKARFTLSGSENAMRSLVNAGDLGATATDLLCQGYLAMNADRPADQVKLRVALSGLFKDRLCDGGFGGPALRSDGLVSFNGQAGPVQPVGNGMSLIALPSSTLVLGQEGSALGFLPRIPDSYGTTQAAIDSVTVTTEAPNDDFFGTDLGNGLTPVEVVLSQEPEYIRELVYPEGGFDVGSHQRALARDSASPSYAGLLLGGGTPPGEGMPAVPLFGDFSRFSVTIPTPSGSFVTIGPGTTFEDAGLTAPPESILDDLSEDGNAPESILDDVAPCRVICSLTPTSGPLQPGGHAYLSGAAAGMGARSALVADGAVLA